MNSKEGGGTKARNRGKKKIKKEKKKERYRNPKEKHEW